MLLARSQPAFLALNTTAPANVTGDGTAYTVVFDNEVIDQGSDFASNTFTAPVDGSYYLATAIRWSGADASADTVDVTIVTSNRSYIYRLSRTNDIAGTYTEAFAVLADMDASDTATVTLTVSGGAKTVDVSAAITYFSGHLVG